MKTKWCISIFIIVFALLGICHTNSSLPNQEIVVKFNDKVSNDQSQNAITNIKQQLQNFGVGHIQVCQVSNGGFRILYHSSATVESIKLALSSSGNLPIDIIPSGFNKENEKLPSDRNQKHYNLDVYEIKGISVDYDLTGTLALESKYVYDRFFNPTVNSNVDDINITIEDEPLERVFNLYKGIALAIENTSHAIPEVRAGPISFPGNL